MTAKNDIYCVGLRCGTSAIACLPLVEESAIYSNAHVQHIGCGIDEIHSRLLFIINNSIFNNCIILFLV